MSDSLVPLNLLQAGHFLLKPVKAKFWGSQAPYRHVRVEHYPINGCRYNRSQFSSSEMSREMFFSLLEIVAKLAHNRLNIGSAGPVRPGGGGSIITISGPGQGLE